MQIGEHTLAIPSKVYEHIVTYPILINENLFDLNIVSGEFRVNVNYLGM